MVTVGNSYTNGQSANVLLTKYASDGTLLWQVEYDNPDNLEDYGISLTEDNNGNIYVAGTSIRNASSSLDLTMLKFNQSGQFQWAYEYNGSANGDDIPVGIVTDGGLVYMAGTVDNTGTGADFRTVALDGSGQVIWHAEYDLNLLNDMAAKVAIDNQGNVTVTGSGSVAPSIVNGVILKYNSGGSLIHEHLSNNSIGFDKPTSGDIALNGDIVIGGYFKPTPAETQISLVRLDDTLGLSWNVLHDPSPLEDQAQDLKIDASGNAFITGHSEFKPGAFVCYTAKFDPLGALLWEESYFSPEGSAFGKRLTLDNAGNPTIVGYSTDGVDTNLLTIQYNKTDGQINFVEEFDAGGTEIANSLASDPWGSIYIHGTSQQNANGYVTLKYSVFERVLVPVNDTIDSINYVDNELILTFQPEVMDSIAIDDKGKTYGLISEFVKPSAIAALDGLYEGQWNFGRMYALKIHKGLTTTSNYSITRTGDTITIPPFWSSLVVLTPNAMNEVDVAKNLDTANYSLIIGAELNILYYPDDLPNDPEFIAGNQSGLNSTATPEYDINMDGAWDHEHGNPNVRVGVIDSGIDWAHADLNTTGTVTWDPADSKVINGWNFENSVPLFSTNPGDMDGHGTNVAGVIGAIRNNGIGVAGIAGGDASTFDFGVSMISLRVGSGQYPLDKTIEAMVEAAKDEPLNTTNPGYACHVINCSFGGNKHSDAQESAVKFVYDNGVYLAASAGNKGKSKEWFPSCYADRFVSRVGASGQDGDRYNTSNFNFGVDFLAPGDPSTIQTLDNNNLGYMDFGQTSSAAAHASGVGALIISRIKSQYAPNQLLQEDIEYLINNTVEDVGNPGYDGENGFGRLNAEAAMDRIEWPFNTIEHFNYETANYTHTLWAQDIDVDLLRGHNGIKPKKYECDVYRVTAVFNHNIGSASLLAGYERNQRSVSTLYNFDQDLTPFPAADVIVVNDSQAVMIGYIYHVKKESTFWFPQTINKWIPHDLNTPAKFAYSLHLRDLNATGVKTNEASKSDELGLFPNPANTAHTIRVNISGAKTISLFDLQGRMLRTIYEGTSDDEIQITEDISDLSSGMYLYTVRTQEGLKTIRFIKE